MIALPFRIVPLDLDDGQHAAALVALLDQYARDPMGGAEPLGEFARRELVARLAATPTYHGALAFEGAQAVGLINCFLGFSTFAARPLLNIHDVFVAQPWRGRGVGKALLDWAQRRACSLDCCKLTLEVLSGNGPAMAAYRSAGYTPYLLNPAAGEAVLLQKKL